MRSRFAPGRRSAGPVGVIDIGSNSIRLVVYAGDERAPHPIFNEKVLCGLGRGLERSNRLNDEGVALALANLSRFSSLSSAMGVKQLRVVGTAAVRDAEDGKAFVAERIELAKKGQPFWQDYKFMDPETKTVLPKEMYCVPLKDVIVCGGVYKA